MKEKTKIAIITSGYFPVPAAMGGAVEALDENLLRQNEIENRVNFIVFSCYNKNAYEISCQYKNSSFIFIRTPKIVAMADEIIYWIAKNILKKKKSMSYRYILQRLHYINKVAKKLKENDYDKLVIENHSTLFMALKKYNNAEKYKGRYFYHLHNVVTNDYGCKKIIGNCKNVIGVSNYINKTLQEFLQLEDNNQYVVLRNRIDRKKFLVNLTEKEVDDIRKKYDLSKDDVVFLFCGRFNEEKGIRELLKAFMHTENNCKLLIVGGYYYGSGMISPFEKEMYEFTQENLKDKVKFTGQIEYKMIPIIYAMADVVVIPSVWDDPAPLTVIEALTSGKALITTDSGGIPEYADNSSSVVLKRDNNFIKNLAKTMNELANDDSRRTRMEEAALNKTKNWNIETFYDDFCHIVDEV